MTTFSEKRGQLPGEKEFLTLKFQMHAEISIRSAQAALYFGTSLRHYFF